LKNPPVNPETIQYLIQARILLGIVGFAVGIGLFTACGQLPIPVLLPVLVLLAGPEIATGWWLCRREAYSPRGITLLFGYAGWGVIRWTTLALYALPPLLAVILYFHTKLKVQASAVPEAASALLIGTLLSYGLGFLLGCLLQFLAFLVGIPLDRSPAVNPEAVNAWMENRDPPP